MTDGEVNALVAGQIVQAKKKDRWVNVEIVRTCGAGTAYVRELGRTKCGQRKSRFVSWSETMRFAPNLDSGVCNVFADYLDDHDEHRAAQMLREAFPRVNEKGEAY